ncbi:hypothetical protein CVT26_016124, partial [Gymnopilus dilepis]
LSETIFPLFSSCLLTTVIFRSAVTFFTVPLVPRMSSRGEYQRVCTTSTPPASPPPPQPKIYRNRGSFISADSVTITGGNMTQVLGDSQVHQTAASPNKPRRPRRHHHVSLNWIKRKIVKAGDVLLPDPDESDSVILVMGPPDSGKSTFIQTLFEKKEPDSFKCYKPPRSKDLAQWIIDDYRNPSDSRRGRLIIVEIPAFADTFEGDGECLRRISAWLAQCYLDKVKITGAIYLHDISLPRLNNSVRRNLDLFHALCGQAGVSSMVFTTTKWTNNPHYSKVEELREKQLKEEIWKDMNPDSHTVYRFQGTCESAWNIVDHIMNRARQRYIPELRIQEEVVDCCLHIPETDAGRLLYSMLVEMRSLYRERISSWRTQFRDGDMDNDLRTFIEYEKKLSQDIKVLRVSWMGHIRRFFSNTYCEFLFIFAPHHLHIVHSSRVITNARTVGITGATITAFSDQRVFNTITQAVTTVAKAKSGRWKKSLFKLGDPCYKGTSNDTVILVMGPPGCGKSFFIDTLTERQRSPGGNEPRKIYHRILDQRLLPSIGANLNGQVVVAEIPSFDDTLEGDKELLRQISAWLANCYTAGMKFGGIVYLHDISVHRLNNSIRKNFDLFRSVCGELRFPSVAPTITRWSNVSEDVGNKRLKQLEENLWEDLVGAGCTVSKFDGTPESAREIVKRMLKRTSSIHLPDGLNIQEEVVDYHLHLPETDAGRLLYSMLKEMQQLYRQRIRAWEIQFDDKNMYEELQAFKDYEKQLGKDIRALEIGSATLAAPAPAREPDTIRVFSAFLWHMYTVEAAGVGSHSILSCKATNLIVLALSFITADSFAIFDSNMMQDLQDDHLTRVMAGLAKSKHLKRHHEVRVSKQWVNKNILRPGDVLPHDPIESDSAILVMGAPNSGKSTFIQTLLQEEKAEIFEHYPSPRARDLEQWVILLDDYISRRATSHGRLTIVEIPAFEDTFEGDGECLRRIAAWLTTCYMAQIRIIGAIYLHDISPAGTIPSLDKILRRNLDLLQALWGASVPERIIFASTKWTGDSYYYLFEEEREMQFKRDLGALMGVSPEFRRFQGSCDSAWEILYGITDRPQEPSALRIQQEIAVLRRCLLETDAGRLLYSMLLKERWLRRQRIKSEKLYTPQGGDMDPYLQDLIQSEKMLTENIQALLPRGIQALDIRFTENMRLLFKRTRGVSFEEWEQNSVYSLADSRTEVSDYGIYCRRMAYSQETLDSNLTIRQ